MTASAVTVAVWIAALAWLLLRQVRPRPVAHAPRISIILIVAGAAECAPFLAHHPLPPAAAAVLIASFTVGVGLGVARAYTARLWTDGGRAWRRGSWLTIVLWLVALASHLAGDRLVQHTGGPAGASSATMLLYLGVSLLVQTLLVAHRARTLPCPAGQSAGAGMPRRGTAAGRAGHEPRGVPTRVSPSTWTRRWPPG